MVKFNYKKQQKINEGKRLLDNNYRITAYDPRINIHNCWEHELSKCKMIYNLKKEGKEVYAEVIFKNGSRADIFVPEFLQVFEILHSETEKMAKKKVEKYPNECEIFFIKSSEILNEKENFLNKKKLNVLKEQSKLIKNISLGIQQVIEGKVKTFK